MKFITNFITQFKNRIRIVGELLGFFWKRKLWWLLPMVVLLILVGVLILVAHSSAVAPFIYVLF